MFPGFPKDGSRCKVSSVRRSLLTALFLSTVLVVFRTPATAATTILPINSVWNFFKGLSEASSPDVTAWRKLDFDDSVWSSGPAPFYYNESLSGTLLGDMQNNYTCVFLRRKFLVTNAFEFGALTLSARCDDGYIAWINGMEVARYNMPADFVPFDGVAILSVQEPVPYIATNILHPSSFLLTGTNVIAVQVFNFAITSGDIQFNATLSGFADTNAPTLAVLQPPAGSVVRTLRSVEATFSEIVTNLDASDLWVNGCGNKSHHAFTNAVSL